jgi:hypothetical protein
MHPFAQRRELGVQLAWRMHHVAGPDAERPRGYRRLEDQWSGDAREEAVHSLGAGGNHFPGRRGDTRSLEGRLHRDLRRRQLVEALIGPRIRKPQLLQVTDDGDPRRPVDLVAVTQVEDDGKAIAGCLPNAFQHRTEVGHRDRLPAVGHPQRGKGALEFPFALGEVVVELDGGVVALHLGNKDPDE